MAINGVNGTTEYGRIYLVLNSEFAGAINAELETQSQPSRHLEIK